jgi:hypothetical protein
MPPRPLTKAQRAMQERRRRRAKRQRRQEHRHVQERPGALPIPFEETLIESADMLDAWACLVRLDDHEKEEPAQVQARSLPPAQEVEGPPDADGVPADPVDPGSFGALLEAWVCLLRLHELPHQQRRQQWRERRRQQRGRRRQQRCRPKQQRSPPPREPLRAKVRG